MPADVVTLLTRAKNASWGLSVRGHALPGQPYSATVTHVVPGSASATAGLQVGDVVTAINGSAVTGWIMDTRGQWKKLGYAPSDSGWSLCFREEILLEDLLPEPRGAMSITLAILKNSPAPKRSATAANPCRDAHAGKPRPLSEVLPEELRHRNVSSRSQGAQERLDQLLRGRDHDMLTCNRLAAQTRPPVVQGRPLETDEWIECVLEGSAPVLVSARVSAC